MDQTLTLVVGAYAIDAGGFRGAVIDKRTGERFASPVLETVQDARGWARAKASALMGAEPWAPGYIYRPYWRMNVWTRATVAAQ